MSSSCSKIVVLRSSDYITFLVEESILVSYRNTMTNWIEAIQLPISSKILKNLICYGRNLEDWKHWETNFADENTDMLNELKAGADYLKLESLQKLIDQKIKGKIPNFSDKKIILISSDHQEFEINESELQTDRIKELIEGGNVIHHLKNISSTEITDHIIVCDEAARSFEIQNLVDLSSTEIADNNSKMVCLKSSDGIEFEVQEASIHGYNTFSFVVMDSRLGDKKMLQLDINSEILGKIVQYLNKQCEGAADAEWISEFVNMEVTSLNDLMLAAVNLNIRSLETIICRKVESLIEEGHFFTDTISPEDLASFRSFAEFHRAKNP